MSTGLHALGLRLPWCRERGTFEVSDKLMCSYKDGSGVNSSHKNTEGGRATANKVVFGRKEGTFTAH